MKAIITLIILSSVQFADAQVLGNIKNKLQQKANDAIDKTIDNATAPKNKTTSTAASTTATVPVTDNTKIAGQPSLKTYSKYDFIPGEKVQAYDDFLQDAVGDFPDKWNTNSSGEIMTVDNKPGKWLSTSKEGLYIPTFIKTLPDNFTLEYDVIFIPPATPAGPNTAGFGFQLANVDFKKDNFIYRTSYAQFLVSPYRGYFQYESYTATGDKILNSETQVANLDRQHIQTYHVAVWRQKTRVRVYLDQNKVCDLPMVLSESEKYNAIRFKTELNNDGSNWLISNIKMAVGAPDTRNKLLTEGKFTTTGILFDVNATTIKPASYGTLKNIADVLKDNSSIKVKIVGHTDSDGNATANLDLSKKRAEAVKNALVNEFGIDAGALDTDGKGASQPVVSNATAEGKASNRRVEFIKM